VVALAAVLSVRAVAAAQFTPSHFEFALIGDLPYDDLQATNLFPNVFRFEPQHVRKNLVTH